VVRTEIAGLLSVVSLHKHKLLAAESRQHGHVFAESREAEAVPDWNL